VCSHYSAKLVLCLAAVYLVWGSSFLFTKIAVSSLPIALFFAIRFLIAGTVLAAIAHFWNKDPWPRRLTDWRHMLVVGFFMVFVSNGLNAWAMQYVPSNESALLNGTAAFWIAGLGVFGPRGHPLTRAAASGLAIGFAGTVLMLLPKENARLARIVAILTASIGFVIGLGEFFAAKAGEIQTVTKVPWIPSLDIEYHLAADGISLTLVLLTGLAAIANILFS